jgi:F-type H+-transporting ATPase subunit a
MRTATKLLVVCGVLALGQGAWAAEEAEGVPGEHHAEAMTPQEFISHHVADSYDWEFEYPELLKKVGITVESPTIHLGKLFSFLKFESPVGACAMAVEAKYSQVPPIGRLANGCFDLRPSKAHLMMAFSGLLVLLLGLSFGNRKTSALVPTGAGQNLWEAFIQFIRDEIALRNIGPKGEKYVPFLASLFIFILGMNWLGLVPGFFSATGSMVVTAGLAVCVLIVSQVAAVRSAGLLGYLAHLTGGMNEMVKTGPLYLRAIGFALMLLFIPIEIVGILVKPFVLTMRLFANMFAGHMVLFSILALALISGGAWYGFSLVIGTVIYVFETFVGLLQAFIFTLLSSIYIGLAEEMGAHGHGHDEAAGHH